MLFVKENISVNYYLLVFNMFFIIQLGSSGVKWLNHPTDPLASALIGSIITYRNYFYPQ